MNAARLREVLGVGRREYLTTEAVAQEFGFPSGSAARQFLRRHAEYFAFQYRGRRIVIDRQDMQAGLARLDDAARKRA